MLELYTDRLKLRSLKREDWPEFLALHQDPVINKFVNRSDDLEVIKEKFEHRLAPWSFESGSWLLLVIEEVKTGKFIGYTGLYCSSLECLHAEVGYMLTQGGQKQGYATESLEAVIDWACLRYNVHKFIGLCAKDNTASQKVLEKNGFKLEGVLRDNYKLDDRWIDDCSYGLLSHERA